MSGWQTLTYDSIAGPQSIKAPAGWTFDSTQTSVWLWLCAHTRTRSSGKLKTQKEIRFVEGKIDALAQILANTLGMAAFYWQQAAKVVVSEGWA